MYFLNVNSRMSLHEGRGTVCLFFMDLAMQTRNSIYLFIFYYFFRTGLQKAPWGSSTTCERGAHGGL